MSDVYVIGNGGHGKQIMDSFLFAGYNVVGVYDDLHPVCKSYREIPILGKIENIFDLPHGSNLFCAIGDNKKRREIYEKFSQNYQFINCIHNLSHVSPTANIGRGVYIGAFSSVLASSVVGDCAIINDGAIVTHDCSVGQFTHVCPKACLGGGSIVGDNVLVGTNGTILPKVSITDNVIVGAGAVVNKDINCQCTVVGVPAKKLYYTYRQ